MIVHSEWVRQLQIMSSQYKILGKRQLVRFPSTFFIYNWTFQHLDCKQCDSFQTLNLFWQIHLDDVPFCIYWYLDGLNIKKLNIFCVKIRFFQIMYAWNMQNRLISTIATSINIVYFLWFKANMYVSEAKWFTGTDWKVKYELNRTSNDELIFNFDDFLLLLYHYSLLYTDQYEIEK